MTPRPDQVTHYLSPPVSVCHKSFLFRALLTLRSILSLDQQLLLFPPNLHYTIPQRLVRTRLVVSFLPSYCFFLLLYLLLIYMEC